MDNKIKRLLFTEEPFFDESFIGYIMRLADLNEIPELRWIFKLAAHSKLYNYKYKFNSDFKVDPQSLSKLTGVSEEKLTGLLYLHQQGRKRNIIGNMIVFGQPILHHFVRRELPKICPLCLLEQNYCRKVWELSPVTSCPVHKCLLLDFCPNCQRRINWNRPKTNICQCEFDFCDSGIIPLENKDVRLTEYLYQKFGLLFSTEEAVFKYPLNTLSVERLLTLLFFFAAVFANTPDYSGNNLSKYKNNAEVHRYLCLAVNFFDDWAKNFDDFIDMWHKQDKRYFINLKNLYLSNLALPAKYGEYELFNQMIHHILFEKQFSFIHEEFQEFLKRLPSEDFSDFSF